ncbi:MAG: gluconeogenesis factor YvcK family protein [Acidimicrobiales bacterium]
MRGERVGGGPQTSPPTELNYSKAGQARPSVVAIGGGHGLAATLRAARLYAGDLTAIVSVADDGGSSGRLRDAMDILPPGDLRKCLVALGDPASVWSRALEHRFEAGELEGHALGNLLIAGLVATTGDYLSALDEVGRLVHAQGRVLPSTTESVVLKASTTNGAITGQLAVGRSDGITQVSLVPTDPEPPRAALQAIVAADQILVGPGSLYTSVLAALAVPALAEAVRQAQAGRQTQAGRRDQATHRAQLIYICNLRQQPPETDGCDVADHVRALLTHGVDPDVVLCDTSSLPLGRLDRPYLDVALAMPPGLAHDPLRLAEALLDLQGWGNKDTTDQPGALGATD